MRPRYARIVLPTAYCLLWTGTRRQTLGGIFMTHALEQLEHFARLDLRRAARTGIPEVVLAERKTPAQTLAIVQRLLDELGRVLLSRVPPEALALLEQSLQADVIWTRY